MEFADCGIKRFVREQEAKGLLGNLGIKTPLSKIPFIKCFVFKVYKNE